MTKKILILIAIVIVAIVAWFLLAGKELSYEKATKMEVSTSSFEGEIISLSENGVLMKAGRTENVSGKNETVYYEKSVVFEDEIFFWTRFKADVPRRKISRPGLLSQLKVGDTIVIYGVGFADLSTSEEFVANEVNLLVHRQ